MTNDRLFSLLSSAIRCDLMMNTSADTSNGWKISIQGKSIKDSAFLFNCLNDFLYENNVPFKVGTQKRFNLKDKEQSKKAMTIYCPNGTDIKELAEDVYSLIMDYKGWQDIKTPTAYEHYAGGLFIRNDRNEYGLYVPAKEAELWAN